MEMQNDSNISAMNKTGNSHRSGDGGQEVLDDEGSSQSIKLETTQ